MIIKGQSRGRSRQLAAHLLRADQNEDIRLYELRGVAAGDVAGALAEMEALSAAIHSKRPLYHASISPEAHRPLTKDQIRTAADTLEAKLGLHGQPRVIVVHRKQGREHLHVVWSRIDVERQRVISDSWNYRAHEQTARELEAAFGHRTIPGAHTPQPRPSRVRHAPKDYEYRQEERSGISPAHVSAELSALWKSSTGAEAFRKQLEEAGYILARGDRRGFVVIDRAGSAHSLSRRLGLRSRELKVQLAGLELDHLPSVAEARGRVKRKGREVAVVSQYRAAARQLAAPRGAARTVVARGQAIARSFAVASEWISLPAHPPGAIMRRHVRRHAAQDRGRYRALRAGILIDYAAKIDEACAHVPVEALDSALARLADEREAALRALERLEAKDAAYARPGTVQRRRLTRRRRALRRRKTLRR